MATDSSNPQTRSLNANEYKQMFPSNKPNKMDLEGNAIDTLNSDDDEDIDENELDSMDDTGSQFWIKAAIIVVLVGCCIGVAVALCCYMRGGEKKDDGGDGKETTLSSNTETTKKPGIDKNFVESGLSDRRSSLPIFDKADATVPETVIFLDIAKVLSSKGSLELNESAVQNLEMILSDTTAAREGTCVILTGDERGHMESVYRALLRYDNMQEVANIKKYAKALASGDIDQKTGNIGSGTNKIEMPFSLKLMHNNVRGAAYRDLKANANNPAKIEELAQMYALAGTSGILSGNYCGRTAYIPGASHGDMIANWLLTYGRQLFPRDYMASIAEALERTSDKGRYNAKQLFAEHQLEKQKQVDQNWSEWASGRPTNIVSETLQSSTLQLQEVNDEITDALFNTCRAVVEETEKYSGINLQKILGDPEKSEPHRYQHTHQIIIVTDDEQKYLTTTELTGDETLRQEMVKFMRMQQKIVDLRKSLQYSDAKEITRMADKSYDSTKWNRFIDNKIEYDAIKMLRNEQDHMNLQAGAVKVPGLNSFVEVEKTDENTLDNADGGADAALGNAEP